MQRPPNYQTAGQRRGPAPMIPNANHQALQMQKQQEELMKADAARRRDYAAQQTRKPVDKNLPEGIDDLVIGNGADAYRKLRDLEQKIDVQMMRKRMENKDEVKRRHMYERTMRIWISNTVENQPWQQDELDSTQFDFQTDSTSTFRVKIEGRLLDAPNDFEEDTEMGEDGQATKLPTTPLPTKFSHFFSKIQIEFDRPPALQPDNYTAIQWVKEKPFATAHPPAAKDDFDCLEIERKGDENINVTIKLTRDEPRERYRFSKPLAGIVGLHEGDRADALHSLYLYIKANNLMENEDSQKVQFDPRMKAAFGQNNTLFAHLPQLLMHHLMPIEPVILPYTIRVDEAFHQAPQKTVYDILVNIFPPKADLPEADINTLKQIKQLDDHLALTVQALHQSKAKHAFFESLSRDPANFINRWTSSQRRDLAIVLGEAARGNSEQGSVSEVWRSGEVWRDGWDGGRKVREGVGMWLNAKDKEDERKVEFQRRQQAMTARRMDGAGGIGNYVSNTASAQDGSDAAGKRATEQEREAQMKQRLQDDVAEAANYLPQLDTLEDLNNHKRYFNPWNEYVQYFSAQTKRFLTQLYQEHGANRQNAKAEGDAFIEIKYPIMSDDKSSPAQEAAMAGVEKNQFEGQAPAWILDAPAVVRGAPVPSSSQEKSIIRTMTPISLPSPAQRLPKRRTMSLADAVESVEPRDPTISPDRIDIDALVAAQREYTNPFVKVAQQSQVQGEGSETRTDTEGDAEQSAEIPFPSRSEARSLGVADESEADTEPPWSEAELASIERHLQNRGVQAQAQVTGTNIDTEATVSFPRTAAERIMDSEAIVDAPLQSKVQSQPQFHAQDMESPIGTATPETEALVASGMLCKSSPPTGIPIGIAEKDCERCASWGLKCNRAKPWCDQCYSYRRNVDECVYVEAGVKSVGRKTILED